MKDKEMSPNQFGKITRYKSLEFLTEKISEMEKSERRPLTKQLQLFNHYCRQARKIKDEQFYRFAVYHIKEHFIEQADRLEDRYGEKLMSYFRNFVVTKTREMRRAV